MKDKRLEMLSNKCRAGESINMKEAIEVILYQEELREKGKILYLINY